MACSTPPRTRGPDGRADGALVFRAYCAPCHGADARRPAGPRQWVLARTVGQRTPAELRATIEQGRGTAMPPWSGRIPPDEIEAVARFVPSLAAP